MSSAIVWVLTPWPVSIDNEIFIATYAVVALGKIPVYRIDRAGAALLGGSLMVATGVLSLEEAYRAVNFNTIVFAIRRTTSAPPGQITRQGRTLKRALAVQVTTATLRSVPKASQF